MREIRFVALLTLTIALVAGACSSDTPGTSLTTTTATDAAGESAAQTTTTVVGADDLDAQMCRTLELLEAAGVLAPSAAVSIEAVDLAEATSQERSAYGNLLISAPTMHCPESALYAYDIAYWLGY